MNNNKEKSIIFTINCQEYKVTSNVPAEASLNTFIRDYANLKGTKSMCKEGGCGACIVLVQSIDPITQQYKFNAVNSCLVPVWSCNGKSVITVEGLGNKQKGYHKIQTYLARFNGTQCGYCTPGMVMNMFSLLKSKPNITMKEVENSFGGNICRCTGYRPILDAFKALASDASEDLKQKCRDIEDVYINGCRNGTNGDCAGTCNDCPKKTLTSITEKMDDNGNLWYYTSKIEEIYRIFNKIENENYMLVAGNTAQGVYRQLEKPKIYIDITRVVELKTYEMFSDRLEIGANLTLTDCMELFNKISQINADNFTYLKDLVKHIDLIANVPVRNIGTLAGNLMIKHKYNQFPSDIFLILETVGAKLILETMTKTTDPLSLVEFLKYNMKLTIIKKIILPALPANKIKFKSFKIMPRNQNVHAYINAGFLFSLNEENVVLDKPSIVYGGIKEDFVHAEKTENFLKGKCITDETTFKKGIQILSEELNPEADILKASPEYRTKLSISLFYRFVLGINAGKVNYRNKSGIENLNRPLSVGRQTFDVNVKNSPIGKPVHKLEAPIQCSGEAEYVGDMVAYSGQVYGALVLARQARAILSSIDPKEALNIPGVLAFYSAKDIPGKNNFMMQKPLYCPADEELFCSETILYAGQPVGVIIAETQELAIEAANKVKITYGNKQKPLITVRDVLTAKENRRIKLFKNEEPEMAPKIERIKHKIKGEYEIGAQYHFTMETQSCVCVPTDEGLNIYASTQWMDIIQVAVSEMLNIPQNSINMYVKRLGGGFGSKITRSSITSCACALAAYKLNRPVKMVLDLETNMEAIGKRCPALSFYEVGFDDSGKIEELNITVYQDVGCSMNDPSMMLIPDGLHNVYDYSTWNIQVYTVLTDTAGCSWMRGPGTIEGFTAIENIMEHISTVLNKDPLEIRMVNLNRKFTLLRTLIDSIVQSSDYKGNRQAIEQFNINNRWKKRGISLVPMVFGMDYFMNYHAMISIYANDGTVSVTLGGVEMGQGLNTKVAQAVAYALGIDLSMIKITTASSICAPNGGMSGASITSESCTLAALKCAEILNKRLEPIRKKLYNASWVDVIREACAEDVNLNASYMNTCQELNSYSIFGVGVSQVEIDVLTGNYQILRSDILEDAGESLSPYIDIGQVEGAFVMGLGYFLTENIKYDPDTGMVLTNRTWNYWPPGVKDIPIEWNVSLAKNLSNPNGVMRSKTTGEPPICLSYSAVTAIRDALKSARKDSGTNEWFRLDQPCSVEKILLAANTSPDQFTF